MVTAHQVLQALWPIYWGGCYITFTLLVFRGLLPSATWDEIQKVYRQHAPSLSGPVMVFLIALVLTPLVVFWPVAWFLECRRRWRQWRQSA